MKQSYLLQQPMRKQHGLASHSQPQCHRECKQPEVNQECSPSFFLPNSLLPSPHLPPSQATQQQLVKGLLDSLRLHSTAAVFQKEQNRKHQANPEDLTTSDQRCKGESCLEDQLNQIIDEAQDFDQMMGLIQGTIEEEKKDPSEDKELSEGKELRLGERQEYSNLERSIQALFKSKVRLTVPVFRSQDVILEERQLRLVDIDQSENLCFLDSENQLHVLKDRSHKARSVKVDSKYHIVQLKWATPQLIVLLTSLNTLLFYQAFPVELLEVVQSHKQHLLSHDLQVTNNMLCVLSCTANALLVLKVRCEGTELKVGIPLCFQSVDPLHIVTTVVLVPESSEHYYGLTHNQKYIIKFDSLVGRAGIFWKVPKKFRIQKLMASKCRQFLIVLLTQLAQAGDSSQQLLLEYTVVRISGDGCLLERTKHTLGLQDFPHSFLAGEKGRNYMGRVLSLSHQMDPWWLQCFSWQNQVYFISLKTGNILYRHQADDQNVRISSVGPSDCLALSKKGLLFLVSCREVAKKVATIDRCGGVDFRERILQRFSRLQGIPENLLILLRSIRTNELQSLQLP